MAVNKKVTEEVDLGNGYTDETLIRVVESDQDFKQRYGDLATYMSGKLLSPVVVTFAELRSMMAAATLSIGALYQVTDLIAVGPTYVRALDVNVIDPHCVIVNSSISPAFFIEADLAIAADGSYQPWTFDRYYNPAWGNVWEGYTDNLFTGFWADMMGNNSNVTETHVKLNAFSGGLTGKPAVCHRSVFEYLDGGYQFGSFVTIKDSFVSYSDNYGFIAGNSSQILNSILGDAGHIIGDSAILNSIQTSQKNGVHNFPSGSTTSNGVVGGRGCSAEYETPIDLLGTSTFDMSSLPFCKTYTLLNPDPGGMNTIKGWSVAENHGSDILLYSASSLQYNIGVNNIYASSCASIASGGLIVVANLWAKVLLNHDSNAYITDFV